VPLTLKRQKANEFRGVQQMKKESKYPLPIREWSEDDRPRERLLKYGEHTLSNVYPVESITIPLGPSFWRL